MFGALIVVFYMLVAFILGVSIFVCLLLLLVLKSKEARQAVKIGLISNVAVAILFATLIVVNLCTFHIKRRPYVKMLKSYVPPELQDEVPRWFFNQCGAYDWYQFALVYPYYVTMIDSTDTGYLREARDDNTEIGGKLTHLTFDASLLVARVHYSDPWGKKESETFWIVLDFSSGQFHKFALEKEALAEANRRGFSGKQLLEDLETHYNRFAGDIPYSPRNHDKGAEEKPTGKRQESKIP
jgi:hypothetical protein